MNPTNEQIIAEARRRAKEQNWRMDIEEYVIEVVREGWTPPEPVVDPDILAFHAWRVEQLSYVEASEGSMTAKAYLAGARMAREQERERAEVLDWLADKTALELHWRADPEEDGTWCVHIAVGGVNDREWNLLATGETPLAALKSARTALAKYRGEA